MSVWYAKQEEYYKTLKAEHPIKGITDSPLSEMSLLAMIQHRMYVERDMDIIADERILQQRVRALLAFMKREAAGAYQDPHRVAGTAMLNVRLSS